MIVMELNVMIQTDTEWNVSNTLHNFHSYVCVQFSKKRYFNYVLSVETYSLLITLSQISIYVNGG